MTSSAARDQLAQWCKGHTLPVDKNEMILCSYESPAMDGVIAFILDTEKEEYFLVKFEFKENSIDRSTFTRLDAFKQAVKEVCNGTTKIEFQADMLGNRLFVKLKATSPGRKKENICMVLDFEGTILYNKNQSDDPESEYLSTISGLSSTSFLGTYFGGETGSNFKIHDIESKDPAKNYSEKKWEGSDFEFKRLCRGRSNIGDKITGVDKKLEGRLLCETRDGYLVCDDRNSRRQFNKYCLNLLDKSNLKVLGSCTPFMMGAPLYACEQFDGNIVIIDSERRVLSFAFNKNSRKLLEKSSTVIAMFSNVYSEFVRQLPIKPLGDLRARARIGYMYHEKPAIFGYPVAFFSDRRDLVFREKDNVLKNYFNFLLGLIPRPLLRLVLDYNILDFCYMIDEAVKEAQLYPHAEEGVSKEHQLSPHAEKRNNNKGPQSDSHEVIVIPDGEFGKLTVKKAP